MGEKKHFLFKPLRIREVIIRNRIAVSPMCMYSSEDGFANHWHLVHLGSRAVGGAGLILTEAAAVSPEGRISPDDLGIWKDEHIQGLKEITQFIEKQGAVPGIQIAHAGRKASTASPFKGGGRLSRADGGWQPVGPSAIPFNEGEEAPEVLEEKGLNRVIEDFATAAERALKAGFKIVEIHAAHGYLLHEFLSPLSNKRMDNYGGTFHNRVRLLLEVTRAVRKKWPAAYPLFVRISATDWVENGWNEHDALELSKILSLEGVDLIDCSSGGLVPDANIPVQKGYQTGFSASIRSGTPILTGAVGLITEPLEAEKILTEGKADMVFLGRAFLRQPYFPLEAANELGVKVEWPQQYHRARPRQQED